MNKIKLVLAMLIEDVYHSSLKVVVHFECCDFLNMNSRGMSKQQQHQLASVKLPLCFSYLQPFMV